MAFTIVWPQATPAVAFLGDLFVRAIRMLVAPTVLVTIAAGITTLADPKRLGGLGGRAIGLFAATTAIAVSVGMAGDVNPARREGAAGHRGATSTWGASHAV